MPAEITLKTILHKIADHLDLNQRHREELHEAIELHDDPEAQAEKARGDAATRDARRAELQAQLDELADPVPAAADPVPGE
jgi:hypothetical protein